VIFPVINLILTTGRPLILPLINIKLITGKITDMLGVISVSPLMPGGCP